MIVTSRALIAFYHKIALALILALTPVVFMGAPLNAQASRLAIDPAQLAIQQPQPGGAGTGDPGVPVPDPGFVQNPPAVTATTIRMAVLRILYNDTTGYTPPDDNVFAGIIRNNADSINNYFAEQSGNATGASLNYIDTIPLNYPTPTACDSYSYLTALTTTWNDAKAQAEANPNNRFDFNAMDQVVIALPKFCDPWRGGADNGGLPKKRQWLYPEYIKSSNMIHEIGHNYSLAHANFLNCNLTPEASDKSISGSIIIDDSCTTTNYGDDPSIMGHSYAGLSSFNGVHWEQLASNNKFGWSNVKIQSLDKNAISPNTTSIGTASYTVDIAPFTAVCSQTKVLKIKRQATKGTLMGDHLYVEYRQAAPGGISDMYFTGSLPSSRTVQIRLKSVPFSGDPNEPQSAGDSQLIGTLRVGQTVSDNIGGVDVTLNGFSAKGANISVRYR